MTEVWGEGVDEAAEVGALLRVGGELLGVAGEVGEIVFGGWVEGLGGGAGAEAVEADGPDGLGEKGAFVREVAPGFPAKELEQGLLDGVFGIGGIAEEAIGDAKEVSDVTVDEVGEGGFAGELLCGLGAGWRQGLKLMVFAQSAFRR